MSTEIVHEIHGPTIHELYVFLNILVVAIIIYIAGRKPLAAALEKRALSTSHLLVETKEHLKKMEAELEKIKKEFKDIEQMKTRLLLEAESDAKNFSALLIKDAQEAATRIIQEARATADHELKSATSQLKRELIQETLDLALQSIEREHSDKVHAQLLEQFVHTNKGLAHV